jgi:seryl-tRNA synthetase
MMPILRQNIKARKANYADCDRVHQLYTQFRHLQFELDQLRQKRNAHAALTKQIVLIDEDHKREKKLKEHSKVGKDYKLQTQDREKLLTDVEHELVKEALKLPNRTHLDSPVGGEENNEVVF